MSEGADSAPGSFRVNYVKDVANNRLKSKIYNVKSHPAKIIIYYCWKNDFSMSREIRELLLIGTVTL